MNGLKKLLSCCSLILVLLFTSMSAGAELIEKIVAILDGELILLSEIREELKDPVAQTLANLALDSTLEEEALPYVIERKLLQREIQYLSAPKEKELAKLLALQYISTNYKHNSPEELRQKLDERGISDEALEQELLLYMKGVDYIRRKFRFNTDIDKPDLVLNLLQKWLKDLKAKAKIQMLDSNETLLEHPDG
ncbi:MAG: hypothetical protein GY801_51485 [bacterium]|nr:hypothetical protein [bacterium]